ncbi:MAG: hypothetical protein GX610_03180 [Rhodococcus sp.]|nr:hypothetical protein [Rhodococcus sp. (in: high G+C Gram-positive bacteria)]
MTTRARRTHSALWGLACVAILDLVFAVLQKTGVVEWGNYSASLTMGAIFAGAVTGIFTFHLLTERGRPRLRLPAAVASAVLTNALYYLLVEALI